MPTEPLRSVAARRTSARPDLEPLESRQLLSALQGVALGTARWDHHPAVPYGMSFTGPIASALLEDPQTLRVADFNGDGRPDALTIPIDSYATPPGGFKGSVSFNAGPKGFAAAINITFKTYPIDLVAADFNHDGFADLAYYDPFGRVYVATNHGNGRFVHRVVRRAGNPDAMAVADLNDDGSPDLAVYDHDLNRMLVLTQTRHGGWRQTFASAHGRGAGRLISGDFNGDGHTDLMTHYNLQDPFTLFPGRGDGTFATPHDVPIGNAFADEAAATADLNADGCDDLILSGFNFDDDNPDFMEVLLSHGVDFTFNAPVVIDIQSTIASVADLNGDGIPDLLATRYRAPTIYPGRGDGTFGTPTALTGPSRQFNPLPAQFFAADLDGDHRPDVLSITYAFIHAPTFPGPQIVSWNHL